MSQKTDPRCVKCKGRFATGGVQIRKIPLGFGFAPGSSTFQVDYIEVKSHIGYCMKCGDETPVEFSRRTVTRKPAAINRKIRNSIKTFSA